MSAAPRYPKNNQRLRRLHRSGRPVRRNSSRRRKQRPPSEAVGFEPRVNKSLKPVLEGVGVPEASPFVPDPFQVEAVRKLESCDVVVSAPTGSGKTWIAIQAIEKALSQGKRAWYASPLKALSNSKYAEFREIFGPERVGILTGDRKENPGAPLVVGTTEILRNQLYDAMYRGLSLEAGLVVLDEAHYLGDAERGVVWEEVIIYLPVSVRLLLLSATVDNADQIARWLNYVRAEPAETVISEQRPVPLYPLFLMPDGELTPLRKRGELFPKVRHFLEKRREHGRGPLAHLPPVGQVLETLEHADLLPAIFFLKSRSDCDQALQMVAGRRLVIPPEQRQKLRQEVDTFLEAYPFLRSHPGLAPLLNLHVAAHHAGHLPHWKLLVERLMQRGLLKAIFSTSTVAAGVNFPARTVVITQSDRFNGREFVDLKATDLLQMTGRAGRRGMDKIGFCLVVPGPFNDVRLVAALLRSAPEPIESQLSINFSMVLNLLLSHQPAEVKQLLGLSLATFQRLERSGGGNSPTPALRALGKVLRQSRCPGPEEAVVRRKRRRRLAHLKRRLRSEAQELARGDGLWCALKRGRVIMDMFGTLAAVLRREGRGDQAGVLVVRLESERRLQKGRPRLDFIALDEIAGCYDAILELPHAGGGRALAQAVLKQIPRKPRPLSKQEIAEFTRRELEAIEQRLAALDEEIAGLVCRECPIQEECHRPNSEINRLLEQAESLLGQVQQQSHAFWYDFVRHLEFLTSEGFVDANGRLTEDGLWASKLRLDQPVLIAEAIRSRTLPEDDPVLLASLLALFVDDREREGEGPYLSERLEQGIQRLRWSLDPMLERLHQWGFDTPPLPLSAAAAMFAWGLGAEFQEAVGIYGGAEGDLAQLIYRTADNLRQLISLRETHPRLAATAREAVELLLRPPVVVPT